MSCFKDDGYPIVELDSDIEDGESSDDDIDVILHGTPEQKRRLRRKSLGQDSSSEDDFEKEMEAELDQTVREIEEKHSLRGEGDTQTQGDGSAGLPNTGVTDGQSGSLSNDDLLYDPSIDEQNQRWVDRQRRKYQPLTAVTTPRPLPHSDAVLNCPACMSLLCLDCQRHSLYKNQYRAMFVMNCNIDRSEILRYPKQADKSRRGRSRKQSEGATEQGTSDAAYYTVRCGICTTEVGVLDEDEVFHFFNVLSSYT